MTKNITPRLEILAEKKLIGQGCTMSLTNNKTNELWRSFLSRQAEIVNKKTTDLISMQIYPSTYFTNFTHNAEFKKWAAIEVTNFDYIPTNMEAIILPGGLYAVFDYKGSSADPSIFQYIFEKYLPTSGYVLADRPHFELLGQHYKNNDPKSEEEIWIPIN